MPKKSIISMALILLLTASCMMPSAVIGATMQPPAVPTNVKVADTLIPTHGSVTVNWAKSATATYYRVRLYRQNPNGTWSNIKIGSGYYKDYGDVSSATLAGLTWVGTYKFQLMAGNEVGWCRGATFSNVFYVAVPAVSNVKANPTLVIPGGSVTITWNRAAGGTYYRIRLYRQNPNGTWSNIKIGSGYYKDYGIVSTVKLTGLSWIGTYKIQVLWGNASGWSSQVSWSNTFSVNSVSIVKDFRTEFVHGNKPAQYQKYIVLHDTEGTGSPKSVVDSWDASNNGVAAHFVVGTDGSIYQCVAMDKIAHHAGFGDAGNNIKYGVRDESRDDKKGTVPIGSAYPDYGMNSYSIGIELVHVNGGSPYTKAQLDALDRLIAYIDSSYGFRSAIIRHKDWRSSNPDTSRAFDTYFTNYQKYRSYKAP